MLQTFTVVVPDYTSPIPPFTGLEAEEIHEILLNEHIVTEANTYVVDGNTIRYQRVAGGVKG